MNRSGDSPACLEIAKLGLEAERSEDRARIAALDAALVRMRKLFDELFEEVRIWARKRGGQEPSEEIRAILAKYRERRRVIS